METLEASTQNSDDQSKREDSGAEGFDKAVDDAIDKLQYFVAAEFIRKRGPPAEERHVSHQTYLTMADECLELRKDMLATEPEQDGGWTKQAESHADFDLTVHYKVDRTTNVLTCRFDTIIEPELLPGFIAVLNESDLYATWLPSWKFPCRLGIRESSVEQVFGIGNQIVRVVADVPPPMKARESIQHAYAIDDIDEGQSIFIRAKSLDPGTHVESFVTGPVCKGMVRVDVDMGILIRKCPPDHSLLTQSQKHDNGDALLLITIKQTVDAHVSFVPLKLINFVTRQVMSSMLLNTLRVAKDVQTGKRKPHADAIAAKPELYQWVQNRIDILLKSLEATDSG